MHTTRLFGVTTLWLSSVCIAAALTDIRLLPLGAGYPQTYPLSEILTAWSPNVTTIPAHYGRFSSLRLFNGSDAADMAEAELYRRSEVPFVVRNPPGLMPAVHKWNDDYLAAAMGPTQMECEINDNKNFLYYKRDSAAAKLAQQLRAGTAPSPPPPTNTWTGSPTAPRPGGDGAVGAIYRAGDNLQQLGKWATDLQFLPRDGTINITEWQRSARIVAALADAEERVALAAGDIARDWAAAPHYQCTAHSVNHPVVAVSQLSLATDVPLGSPSSSSSSPSSSSGLTLADWERLDNRSSSGDGCTATECDSGSDGVTAAAATFSPLPHTLARTSGFNRTMHYGRLSHGLPGAPPQLWIGRWGGPESGRRFTEHAGFCMTGIGPLPLACLTLGKVCYDRATSHNSMMCIYPYCYRIHAGTCRCLTHAPYPHPPGPTGTHPRRLEPPPALPLLRLSAAATPPPPQPFLLWTPHFSGACTAVLASAASLQHVGRVIAILQDMEYTRSEYLDTSSAM